MPMAVHTYCLALLSNALTTSCTALAASFSLSRFSLFLMFMFAHFFSPASFCFRVCPITTEPNSYTAVHTAACS